MNQTAQTQHHFDGETYNAAIDQKRLNTALGRVWKLMRDGRWRTLREVADSARCSESGASARLRDLRKRQLAIEFNVAAVESKRDSGGVWRYRLVNAGVYPAESQWENPTT